MESREESSEIRARGDCILESLETLALNGGTLGFDLPETYLSSLQGLRESGICTPQGLILSRTGAELGRISTRGGVNVVRVYSEEERQLGVYEPSLEFSQGLEAFKDRGGIFKRLVFGDAIARSSCRSDLPEALDSIPLHQVTDLNTFTLGLKEQGLEWVPMGADGNCLLRSLSFLLFGTPEHHLLVRAVLAGYVCERQDLYSKYNDWDAHGKKLFDVTSVKRQGAASGIGLSLAKILDQLSSSRSSRATSMRWF